MLYSTFEEQKIIDSIPDEIFENIKEKITSEIEEPLQDEIAKVENDFLAVSEERDKLLDACLHFAMCDYILTLPKNKRKTFTLSAMEIARNYEELDSSFISFRANECFDGICYKIENIEKTFKFTKIEV